MAVKIGLRSVNITLKGNLWELIENKKVQDSHLQEFYWINICSVKNNGRIKRNERTISIRKIRNFTYMLARNCSKKKHIYLIN